MNEAVQGWKSPIKVYSRGLSSLYSLPSLALFFPRLKHRDNLGGVTGGRKMEETAMVSLTWLFILLNHTMMCH